MTMSIFYNVIAFTNYDNQYFTKYIKKLKIM